MARGRGYSKQVLARRGYGWGEKPPIETLSISFLVDGKPVGKQRPRFYKGNVITPAETISYEKKIADIARPLMNGYLPYLGKVFVNITHFHVTEKYADLDNIIKSVLDGLNGVVYKDDKQVCKINSERISAGQNYLIVDVRGVV